jgi:hypothetical protein
MDISIRVPYYKIVFQVQRQDVPLKREQNLAKEVLQHELLQAIEQEREMFGQMFPLR